MSQDTLGQLVVFSCDGRGCEAEFTASGTFKDVWERAKEDGWRAFMNSENEWEHRCPMCRGRTSSN